MDTAKAWNRGSACVQNVHKRHRFRYLAFDKILSILLLCADYIHIDISTDFLGNINIFPGFLVDLKKYSRGSAFENMASHSIYKYIKYVCMYVYMYVFLSQFT